MTTRFVFAVRAGCGRAVALWCLAVILGLGACRGARAAEEGGVWKARELLPAAERALSAAAQAAAKGDAEKVKEHNARAKEQLDEARLLFEQGGIETLDDTGAVSDYAKVLSLLGDVDLAAEALRRAAALEPENASIWLALGRGLLTTAYPRPDEAAQALRKAADAGGQAGTTAEALALLGKLQWDRGLYDLARDEWAKALELDAGNVVALAGAAALDIRGGRVSAGLTRLNPIQDVSGETSMLINVLLAKAVRDFQSSGLSMEDTAQEHTAYAMLLLRVGLYQDAVGPLERAVKLDPGNYMTWNTLGSLSEQFGMADRAREAFSRSLQLKPDQPRTRQALDALEKQAGQE